MILHQIFAQIVEKEIRNVILCDNFEVANSSARNMYGSDAIAVECTQYPVGIGDKYINNRFYRNDEITVVPYIMTAEEDVTLVKAKMEDMDNNKSLAELDTDYRLSLLELGLV